MRRFDARSRACVAVCLGLAILFLGVALVARALTGSWRRRLHNPSLIGDAIWASRVLPRDLSVLPRLRPLGTSVDLPIFYINLDRSKARRAAMERQLERIKAPFYERVDAIDGGALARGSLQLKGQGWAERLPECPAALAALLGCDPRLRGDVPAELGCTLSHLKAVARAYEARKGTALILEDDADLTAEAIWPHSLKDLATWAPPGWHIISLYSSSLSDNAELYPIGDVKEYYGAVAYLVSPAGQEAIAQVLARPEVYFPPLVAEHGSQFSCASDRLMYWLTGKSFKYTYPMVSTVNNTSDLDSTIHPDHTRWHLERAAEILDIQLKTREPARCIWFCWTGDNEMPPYIQECLRTWKLHNEPEFEVRLLTPDTIPIYLPWLHPAYENLSYVHRADYLRAAVLHVHGGMYVDIDAICLAPVRGSFKLLADHDVVGYDGSKWAAAMLARPLTAFTAAWISGMEAVLTARADDLRAFRAAEPSPNKDCLGWTEILRDVVLPLMEQAKADPAAATVHWALAPGDWQPIDDAEVMRQEPGPPAPATPEETLSELKDCRVLMLNNSLYPSNVKAASKNEIHHKSPLKLFRILAAALERARAAAATRSRKAGDIGAIYYINLARRTDRRHDVEKELNMAFPHLQAQRFEAVDDAKSPQKGCLMSHINVLRQAKQEHPGQNVLICEDDVEFAYDAADAVAAVLAKGGIDIQWDVLMLSAHIDRIGGGGSSTLASKHLGFAHVLAARSTACYLVRADYVKTLLEVYERALASSVENGWQSLLHCTDRAWTPLMARDYWYAFQRCSVARQRPSQSDIEMKYVDHTDEDCKL